MVETKKTIVFAGGGTAGHVMPNLALIEALRGKYHCIYVGGDGMERELCKARGIPFYRIDTVKLRRDATVKNIAVPFKLASCVRGAKRVLEEIKPDLVFSKGGYAALPVVLAAKHIPILAHESDASAGLVTKLSKRRAKYVLCAFSDCAKSFKNGMYVGTPLSPALYHGDGTKFTGSLSGKKPVLLVMGGSSGALALNDAVTKALPRILKHFDVIHLTGKNKSGAPKTFGYVAMEFCDRMPDLYAAADIALTRGGAGALSELVALNIPALAVPLEKASRGDQIQNAEYYRSAGAIEVARETELTPAVLEEKLVALYRDRAKYAAAMNNLHVDGTEKICNLIKELC